MTTQRNEPDTTPVSVRLTPANGTSRPPPKTLKDVVDRVFALEGEVSSLKARAGALETGLDDANRARHESYTSLKGEIMSAIGTNVQELRASVEIAGSQAQALTSAVEANATETKNSIATVRSEMQTEQAQTRTQNSMKYSELERRVRSIDERLDSRRLLGAFSLTILLYAINLIINLVRK